MEQCLPNSFSFLFFFTKIQSQIRKRTQILSVVRMRNAFESPLYGMFFWGAQRLLLWQCLFPSSVLSGVSMKDGITVCAPSATITALQIYRCQSRQGLCLTLDTATLPHDKINSWESSEILGNMSSVALPSVHGMLCAVMYTVYCQYKRLQL